MNIRRHILSVAFSAASYAVLCSPLSAQKVDLSKKPDPAPVREVPFPKYEEMTLKNGMKILVIEDHEQPTILFRMILTPGSVADGSKTGLASLTASLLTKGAGTRSALDIAKALDGIGANINTNASGDAMTVSASGLKKHMGTILDLYKDVLTRPTFSSEELEKLRTQTIEGIRYEKSQPDELVQALARKVVYGESHPYAQKESEASLESITLDDVKTFHSTYFKPNNAYLAIVGDISSKEMRPLLEKAFADWKKGSVPTVTVPPIKPMPMGVYFIERPASVQSAFVVTGPAEPRNHPDYEKISVASDVIGSGFGGRLFRTLRETYSYTYTPFGFVTSAKTANRFVAGADVRNNVTDSAIIVTQRELKTLTQEPPSDESLNRLKRYTVGSFLMSFERTEVLATYLQQAYLYNIPVQRIKEFPKTIMAITPQQVQAMAAKYMNPEKLPIVVVGSSEVLPKIEQFGTVYHYNLDIEPERVIAMETVDMSADNLIEKHLKAIGGKSAIGNLKALKTTSKVTLKAGPQSISGTAVAIHKMPGKMTRNVDLTVMKQQSWVDGAKAWEATNGMPAEAKTGKELEDARYNSYIVPLAALQELGYTAKVTGKKGDAYILAITSQGGDEKTVYIDANSMLVTKIEATADTPQGTIPVVEEYKNYTDVAGVQLPAAITTTMGGGMMVIQMENAFEANPSVTDGEFAPSK